MTRDLTFADVPDPAAARERPAPRPMVAPAEPSPTRSERRRRVILCALGAAFWVSALTVTSGLRSDIRAVHVAGKGLAWTFLALGALGIALLPDRRGLPPSVRVVRAVVVAVPVFYAIIAFASSRDALKPALGASSILPCLGLSIALAFVPLLLAAAVFSRTFLSAAPWRAAALGAAVGLSGSIGVHAHCPIEAASHVLLAHGGPILLGTLAGAGFGALRGRV
jgi:hypothetical protein